jgi:hypothetical protein
MNTFTYEEENFQHIPTKHRSAYPTAVHTYWVNFHQAKVLLRRMNCPNVWPSIVEKKSVRLKRRSTRLKRRTKNAKAFQ